MKGDIIELLSLNEYNNEKVQVGWRFRVDTDIGDGLISVDIPNDLFMGGSMLIRKSQYRLYHRPFKNKLIALYRYVWNTFSNRKI